MRAKIFRRYILPRWNDLISPVVLSAVALIFLLSFGHASKHPSTAGHAMNRPSQSSSAWRAYPSTSRASEINVAPVRGLQESGGLIETILICPTPHADSSAGLPLGAPRQAIVCTFKPL